MFISIPNLIVDLLLSFLLQKMILIIDDRWNSNHFEIVVNIFWTIATPNSLFERATSVKMDGGDSIAVAT